jgi:Zn-finger protein
MEPCRCGHGKEWHDSCSKCFCPFYLPKSTKNAALARAWLRGRADREAREGTDA